MDTEKNVSSENTVSSQNDEDECHCRICFTAYKSPRILPCKHIFCRLCLIKLADKKQDADSAEELVPLTCPLCREVISLSNGGVDELPMYFKDDDENDDENAGDKDVNDVDDDQRDLCVFCENSVPAEYECFQCQKVFCGSCKNSHDKWLKHDVQDLKLDLSQDKCLKHPEVKLGYFCMDCGTTLCKECVKSEHSRHQTQTLESYLMEIDGELKDYSSNIKEKLDTVEMSQLIFSSNTKSKVLENIENVKNLGEEIKMELEKACRLETKNKHEDKKLLNRIKSMGKKIKKSKRQRKFNKNLISEIQELQAKIITHKTCYLSNDVDHIINNEIGMMDVQMGRLFEFQLQKKIANHSKFFFFGNINWMLSVKVNTLTEKKKAQKRLTRGRKVEVSLKPFRDTEDIQLIESITTTVTFYVDGGDEKSTASKQFTETFQSDKDQLQWKFKDYGKGASCVKVLFQKTNIKDRVQMD